MNLAQWGRGRFLALAVAGILELGCSSGGKQAADGSASERDGESSETVGAAGGRGGAGGVTGLAGAIGSGGNTGSGGSAGVGGSTGSGGSIGSGGTTGGSGGRPGSGGTTGGSGGRPGSGGISGGSGGNTGSGGLTGGGSGGKSGMGGAIGSGGSTGFAGNSGGTLPASDEFGGTSLDPSWMIFNPNPVTVSVAQGALSLTAVGDSFWYAENTGVLVYKLVTGNFKATTTVHVRQADGVTPLNPANQGLHLSGLMARNPTGSSQNYVLLVIGVAENSSSAVEYKDTTNNNSVWGETPWPPDAELRLCRVGAAVTVFRRNPGDATWTMSYQTSRPDLPATLQVGPTFYDHTTPISMRATFDRFAFEPVGAGCAQ